VTLLEVELEHEIWWKSISVSLDRLNERPGFDAVECRKVHVEHDPPPSDEADHLSDRLKRDKLSSSVGGPRHSEILSSENGASSAGRPRRRACETTVLVTRLSFCLVALRPVAENLPRLSAFGDSAKRAATLVPGQGPTSHQQAIKR
jgi:hypothetical protein